MVVKVMFWRSLGEINSKFGLTQRGVGKAK